MEEQLKNKMNKILHISKEIYCENRFRETFLKQLSEKNITVEYKSSSRHDDSGVISVKFGNLSISNYDDQLNKAVPKIVINGINIKLSEIISLKDKNKFDIFCDYIEELNKIINDEIENTKNLVIENAIASLKM